MSTNEESNELKAGHPPAVKVGAMRITQHKPAHEKPQEPIKKEETKSDEENEEVEEAQPPTVPKQTLVISGAVAKGDADFPPEAIKAFHEKPTASHEYRQPNKNSQIIHQPRK
ncbi:death-associated protein 1-like protein [Leptotrombidium deliense]|uniref:Death-associated protein 1-like protein n=1 Tax=Leptotrombidium deliense TaxID=299467 RepID=A0A443SWH8_9ACAR|nr:death-associated protein 1-like protein [Leptotrombidium deliense]